MQEFDLMKESIENFKEHLNFNASPIGEHVHCKKMYFIVYSIGARDIFEIKKSNSSSPMPVAIATAIVDHLK